MTSSSGHPRRQGTRTIRNRLSLGAGIAACVILAWVLAPAGEVSLGQPSGLTGETVRVGVLRDFPPQYQLGAQGQPEGFAVDTLEWLANEAGLTPSYQHFDTWPEAHAALESGAIDLLPNIGVTEERAARFEFSAPLETFAVRLFVRAAGNELQSLADLSGRRVAVVQSNAASNWLPKHGDVTVVPFDKPEQGLFALLANRVDAFAYPEPWAKKLARDARLEDRIMALSEPLLEVDRAVAVRKGNTALLARIAPALERLVRSPAYEQMYSKWYGSPAPFWTMNRALWTLGTVMGLALLAVAAWLVRWRFRSIVSLNRELQAAVREREIAVSALAQRRQTLETEVAERTVLLEERNAELHTQIAERLRVEDALKRSEALVMAAQQLSNLGVWEWAAGTDTVLLTDEARRVLGLDTHDSLVPFDTFIEHIHPEDRSQFVAALYRAMGERGSFDVEYRVTVAEGGQRQIRGFGCAFTGHESDAEHVVGAVHDLTQTREVQRMKREFVSVVSHELRTPLTAIRGAIGLLEAMLGGSVSDEARNLLNIAHRNTHRLVHLVNDILDIEKLESGKMQFSLEPVDLWALVSEAIDANRTYAQQFNVAYMLLPNAERAMVFADSKRLMQVLSNLMSNAAKFAPPGSTVDISISRQRGRVRVAVADRGCGIAESFRDKVFEKFTQQDSSDSRAKGGTGLGLAISKAIMEQLGGTISFESQVGVGTTFYFDLPEWVAEASRAVSG